MIDKAPQEVTVRFADITIDHQAKRGDGIVMKSVGDLPVTAILKRDGSITVADANSRFLFLKCSVPEATITFRVATMFRKTVTLLVDEADHGSSGRGFFSEQGDR